MFLYQAQLPRLELSRWERTVHISVWVIGLILINLPFLALTVGPFYGEDYSLLVPSIYGTLMNALLFYKISATISSKFKEFSSVDARTLLKWFVTLTLIESAGDLIYLLLTKSAMDGVVVEDVLLGNPLMNLFLFAIPAVIYGTIFGWRRLKMGVPKIEIRDGHESVFLESSEVYFIESEGNYSKFHTVRGNVLERISLSDLLGRLPENFFRCHKSYIVNIDLISKKSSTSVEIYGTHVPIGRKYKGALLERIN